MDRSRAGQVPLPAQSIYRADRNGAPGREHLRAGTGASAFPRHYHCANEEAIFVLEGEGEIAIGEAQAQIRAGDFIALPRGREHAHRVSNPSQGPLSICAFQQ